MASPTSISRIQKLPEDVIRKIKAGEVIVRPFNAVKELIENSLDAKATHVVVKVKGGGKDLIQVQDNGIGISKEDLKIAYRKHTTSKLSTFDDLSQLTTYGFRGEALSSMSDASQLTIISRTRDCVCGYKISIIEGNPESDEPIPLAANPGTIVMAKQLFFNMPIRRKSLKSAGEEYNSIVDLVAKYAVHCSNFVSFVLEKEETRTCDVQTMIESQTIDNIRLLYGKEIASNITPIMASSPKDIFKMTGFISQINYSLKKMIFILFINNRLVDCAPLKKSIELIYSNFLVKGSHPFVYLSIKMDPKIIDVNVHPSKNEVRFLYEDHILTEVKAAIETKLSKGTSSKVINTLTSSPTLTVTSSSQSKSNQTKLNSSFISMKISPKVYPSQKVRTNAKDQTINEIWQRNELCLSSGENVLTREIKLDSILSLRKEVFRKCDLELHRIIKDSCLVGCISENLIAIQHETKMLITDIEKLSFELFYQIYLQDFGNFANLKFTKPYTLSKLYEMYINHNPNEDSKELDYVNLKLTKKYIKEMVEDYFSIKIDQDATLSSIPLLLNGYSPNKLKLPKLIYDLVHKVDWNDEKPCFQTFGIALSQFYSASYHGHDWNDWEKMVSSVLYPKIKAFLKPSEDLNVYFKVITTTNELYKVFERC